MSMKVSLLVDLDEIVKRNSPKLSQMRKIQESKRMAVYNHNNINYYLYAETKDTYKVIGVCRDIKR